MEVLQAVHPPRRATSRRLVIRLRAVQYRPPKATQSNRRRDTILRVSNLPRVWSLPRQNLFTPRRPPSLRRHPNLMSPKLPSNRNLSHQCLANFREQLLSMRLLYQRLLITDSVWFGLYKLLELPVEESLLKIYLVLWYSTISYKCFTVAFFVCYSHASGMYALCKCICLFMQLHASLHAGCPWVAFTSLLELTSVVRTSSACICSHVRNHFILVTCKCF